MFTTIGFIVGFIAGWFVNEKFEDVTASKETKILEKNKMFGSMRMIMIGVMVALILC